MNPQGIVTSTVIATKPGPGLSRFLRPAVSAALLIFLFQTVGLSHFLETLAKASVPWLVCGLLLVVAALVISAYKWQGLLTVQRVQVPLPKLFTSYLVGLFFNNFLPTNIGGDVVRIADIGRYSGKMREAAASVVGERILAGFALGLTAIVGLVFSYEVSRGFTGAVVGLLVLFGVVITVFANPQIRQYVSNRIRIPNAFSLRRRVAGIGRSLGDCFGDKGIVAWVLLLSLAFHCTVILVNYAIFLALGVDVSLVQCFLVVPIIMALQMLPISVNGLGVREGAYIYFFGWMGVDAATAIAGSLLFWALVTLISLFGGLIFALRR